MGKKPPHKKTKRRTIHDLIGEIPSRKEIYAILFGLVDEKPSAAALDRTAAIVGAAFLEDMLKTAILAHLRPTLTEAEKAEIFDDHRYGAPLNGFSSRIRIAYALGILDQTARRDLNTIRRIRVAFAHAPAEITFATPEVAQECSSLRSFTDWEGDLSFLSSKQRFMASVLAYYQHLIYYRPKDPAFQPIA